MHIGRMCTNTLSSRYPQIKIFLFNPNRWGIQSILVDLINLQQIFLSVEGSSLFFSTNHNFGVSFKIGDIGWRVTMSRTKIITNQSTKNCELHSKSLIWFKCNDPKISRLWIKLSQNIRVNKLKSFTSKVRHDVLADQLCRVGLIPVLDVVRRDEEGLLGPFGEQGPDFQRPRWVVADLEVEIRVPTAGYHQKKS